jgi:hypothetical protein
MTEDNAHEQLIKKGDEMASKFVYIFAWFWSVVSSIYFFAVTFLPIHAAAEGFANIILGFLLGTCVSTVIGYFYGSSGNEINGKGKGN